MTTSPSFQLCSRTAVVFAVLVAMMGASAAVASPIYTLDNGVDGGSHGYTAGNDVLAGVYFATIPGFDSLNMISVFWGQLPGADVTLAIIDDPNGDQSLADGVIVRSFVVSPVAGDVGSFVSYDFPSTLVSAGFFLAAYIENGPGGAFPIYRDTSGVNVGGAARALQFDGTLLQLAQGAPSFPSDGYWMIRAEATAVPEPSTLMLTLIGLGGGRLAVRRRRNA